MSVRPAGALAAAAFAIFFTSSPRQARAAGAGPASAPAPAPAPADKGDKNDKSDKEAAKALFQRAERSFNLGKFQEALADYQTAYEAKPLPAFLFNIAQCYRNMGNYERARFHYRRYLSLEPRSPNRALVEDLIAEMTRLVDKQNAVRAAAPPAPAPATAAPAAMAPPPPADAPAGGPAAGTATGSGVAVALAPAPAPAAAPAAPGAVLTAQSSPPTEERPVYGHWWFWAAIGAAVAGGVTAALLLSRQSGPTGTLSPIDGR